MNPSQAQKLSKWEEAAAHRCLAKIQEKYGDEFKKISEAHIVQQLKDGKQPDLSSCIYPQHLIDARGDTKYYMDLLEAHRSLIRKEELAEAEKQVRLEEADKEEKKSTVQVTRDILGDDECVDA